MKIQSISRDAGVFVFCLSRPVGPQTETADVCRCLVKECIAMISKITPLSLSFIWTPFQKFSLAPSKNNRLLTAEQKLKNA